jgi:hypothetical protein
MNVAGYNILFTVLHFIYIFAYCARSNLVMNFVIVMFLILIFWIKLLIKLAKFPTLARIIKLYSPVLANSNTAPLFC